MYKPLTMTSKKITRHPLQINDWELLPAGTKQHPQGSCTWVCAARGSNQLPALEMHFLPLSSSAEVAGVARSLHLFLPQDFLAICVRFQSTSHAARDRSLLAAVTPTAFSGRQSFGLPRNLDFRGSF